jgi:DNA-binding NtrC family response regulator
MNEHPTSKDLIIGIVDDQIDGSELFQDALSTNIEGVSVVSFNDPEIALEHYTANKESYALVISDLRMPNLNGLELLYTVKKLNPNVRTVLITAHNVDNDIVFQHYLQLGIVDSIIQKPFTISDLCHKVRNEIQIYQLTVALKQT